MTKAATIVFADTNTAEGLGRAVNALTTAKEFNEAGDEALVIFEGAGTKWVDEFARSDHQYHELFEDVRDQVEGACAYCATAFGVKDRIEAEGVPLMDDFRGHPSINTLIADGYQVLTF